MKRSMIDAHMHITQWENADGSSAFEALKHYQESNRIAYVDNMCWHIADPQVFRDSDKVSEKTKAKGWFYGDGTYPSYEKLIERYLPLMPNTKNRELTEVYYRKKLL